MVYPPNMTTMDEYIEQLLVELYPDNPTPWCCAKHPGWAHPWFCQGTLVKALTAWEISTFPSTTQGKREEKEGPRGRIRPHTSTKVLEICEGVPGWHPWLLWQERSKDRRAGLQIDSMGDRKVLEGLADGCAQRASTGCWPLGFPRGGRTLTQKKLEEELKALKGVWNSSRLSRWLSQRTT